MHDREYLPIAWAQAWPFVSRIAFDQCLVDLVHGPTAHHKGDGYADEKARHADHTCLAVERELETWLRPRTTGQSLNELGALRQRAWFGAVGNVYRSGSRPLAEYVGWLADVHLRHAGQHCELGAGGALTEQELPFLARRFRWLTLCIPADLLIASACAQAGCQPTSDWINVVSPFVQRVLDEGMAETHVHLGAALGFPLVWTAFISEPNAIDPLKGGGDDAPFGDMHAYNARLWASAVVRLMLARFLYYRRTSAECDLAGHIAERLVEDWYQFVSGYTRTEVRDFVASALAILRAQPCPVSSPKLAAEFQFYTRLRKAALSLPRADPQQMPVRGHALEIAARDPLSAVFPAAHGLASPETRFATASIAYMRTHGGSEDRLFTELFWQYTRVRVATFRYLTVEPGTPGLDWFQRHSRRLSSFRRLADAAWAAAELQSSQGALQALELRVEPRAGSSDLLEKVAIMARAHESYHARRVAQPRPLLEWGMVLHWLKREPQRGAAGEECPRYARWARDARNAADGVRRALEEVPEALAYVRGVDVASAELALPNWVTADALLRVRDASVRVAHRLHREHPDWHVTPLRLTYHAGEEYRRLVEGLRRVHELVELGLLRAGDRIGHGLALADGTLRTHAVGALAHQPAEERLDDLLWELDRYDRGELVVPGNRTRQVESEVNELVARLYGQDAAAVPLRLFQHARRTRAEIAAAMGYPDAPRSTSNTHLASTWAITHAYLADPCVIARGQEICEIRLTDAEVAMQQAAQRWLRTLLAQMQVTIECNPSSNHLVGGFNSLDEHPALSLQPLAQTTQSDSVMISINSDDPLTFATRLADEFGHMYNALLRSGVSSRDALLWLDRVRMHGLRSRFTLPASHSTEVVASLRAKLPHAMSLR